MSIQADGAAARPGKRGATIDEIYRTILDSIIDQRLLPGTKLAEEELADIFRVSRRQIEKALVRLTADGLVTHERNRGARVRAPTPQEARDVFELRRVLETAVVRRVAERRPPLGPLLACIAAEEAARSGDAPRRAVHHSGEYHVVLADLSGNAEFRVLVWRLVARTSLITHLYRNEAALTCWHDDHRLLVEMLQDGRAEPAAQLMSAHLTSIENALRLDARSPRADGLRGVLFDR